MGLPGFDPGISLDPDVKKLKNLRFSKEIFQTQKRLTRPNPIQAAKKFLNLTHNNFQPTTTFATK